MTQAVSTLGGDDTVASHEFTQTATVSGDDRLNPGLALVLQFVLGLACWLAIGYGVVQIL